VRPVRRAHNFDICIDSPQHLTTLYASTACNRDGFTGDILLRFSFLIVFA
jgi:hypothetical protein